MKSEIETPETINTFNWLISFGLLAFLMSLCACNTNRILTGKVTAIQGKNITIDNKETFKVFDTSGLYMGKQVSFNGTVVRSKINSRRAN